jgi:hypothetical protein
VFILLIFYSAPLSALAEVLRTRCSASLYLPFAAMNVVNGLLWTTYGLALGDSFIYGPNMVRLSASSLTTAGVLASQQGFVHADYAVSLRHTCWIHGCVSKHAVYIKNLF